MLLAFVEFDKIVLWIAILSLVLGVIVMVVTAFTVARKKKNGNSADSTVNGDTHADDALAQGDGKTDDGVVVMSRNVMYSVGVEGQMRAGKYVMKSADGAADKFNVRYNGLVKEYANGDTLVLIDGDTISPVSGTVMLEPFIEG